MTVVIIPGFNVGYNGRHVTHVFPIVVILDTQFVTVRCYDV